MNEREQTSLRNMEYNRYLSLRYSLALFFFANLNWSIFLFIVRSLYVVIPLAMLLFAALPVYDQIRLYSQSDKVHLKRTLYYFSAQLSLNILLFFLSFVPAFFTEAFPFMADTAKGRLGIRMIVGLGIVIAAACLRKLYAIHRNKDRAYQRILNFKKSLKASGQNGKQ